MNGQEIPGFYWDSEKKKYFKIQSATASRDMNLKYSAQNIRRKEREEQVQGTANAQFKRAQKERITRQHASNLTHICQERELGLRRRSYYVQGNWPNACFSGVSTKPKRIIDGPAGAPIRRFDRDPVTKTMYIVHGENSIKRRRAHKGDGPPLPSHDHNDELFLYDLPLNEYSFEPWDELQRTTSTVSSLSYLPATGALATTTYGSDRPPVVYLSDPERDGPYVGQQFTPKGCAAIWGAAARPISFEHSPGLINSVAASHVEHLAVAASSSMLLFTRSQSGAWDSTTPVASLDADVLALDWVSYTTIALGCRDGKIRLYDTRSGGSSHIFTHPHPVSKIKRADDQTRLIVSGLHDSLHLYDIRSPRISRPSKSLSNSNDQHYNETYFHNLYPGSRNHKKRRKMNHIAYKHWSQPVLTFAHANADDLDLDIAVNSRLGLVVAAQDSDSKTAVRVSNMWTGKTVREFERSGKGKDRIRCLRFMEDEEDGNLSMWAAWDGEIARFGW